MTPILPLEVAELIQILLKKGKKHDIELKNVRTALTIVSKLYKIQIDLENWQVVCDEDPKWAKQFKC